MTKLKKNLPLLLQILMVCLAALALANPMWFSFTHQTGDMILVIDTSASMQTRIESKDFKTRFDQAVDKVLEIIENRKGNQKILIIDSTTANAGANDTKLESPASTTSRRIHLMRFGIFRAQTAADAARLPSQALMAP